MTLLQIFLLGSLIILTRSAKPQLGKLDLVSDLLPADCYKLVKNYTSADKTDGLPKCIDMNKGKPTACSIYYFTRAATSYKAVLKPTCGKDGWFYPIQCKGDHITGRCFCYDNFGKRLYGNQWWSKADDMTCACSRRKAEMKDKIQYFNSLHCSSEGNYESLQCDVESGQCWCANKKTGDPTSPVVPDKVKAKLPCYSSIDVGSKYLRQCDSKMYARKRILYELALHGTKSVTFGELLCDEDGSYGAYKVIDGSAYCTWKDDTKLGSYQFAGNRTLLNCCGLVKSNIPYYILHGGRCSLGRQFWDICIPTTFTTDIHKQLFKSLTFARHFPQCCASSSTDCARDTRIYKDAGKTLTVACEGSGNYKPFQDSLQYCVDSSGYRITRPTDKPTEDESCKSYGQW